MNERYYRSYGLGTQQAMLSDQPRTQAFHDALQEVCSPGCTVLDVGAGTGILSIFAAQAGADFVIAVEANKTSARVARTLVETNKLQGKVLVLEGLVEDLADTIDKEISERGGKLDVLVSEWLGFVMIYEGMFPSVIFARDRWKPKHMVPQSGDVYLCPFAMEHFPEKVTSFWQKDIYGINFQSISKVAQRCATEQPLNGQIEEQCLLASSKNIWHLDCRTASVEEASKMDPIESTFEVTNRGLFHGFCVYFTLQLSNGVSLSCAPDQPTTHWMQMLMLLHAHEGSKEYPTMWPADKIKVTFGFGLKHDRFVEVTANGSAKNRGGMKPTWNFDQKWTITPDPVIEPTDESRG